MTKLHIHHGLDLASPSRVRANAAVIDSRPLHGITVALPNVTDDIFSGEVVTPEEAYKAVADMPRMNKCVHNFGVVHTMHGVDWHSDALWSLITRNFTNLAMALREKGQFDGIFFDVEKYGGTGIYPWNWPGSIGTNLSLRDAVLIVMKRGRAIGDAVGRAWPTCQLLTTYGPWVGTAKTTDPAYGGWNFGYNNTSATNELMGAFAGGLAWGMAASGAVAHGGRYVDGGEVYQARTPEDFSKCYAWMKTNIAKSGTSMIPSPTSYPATVSVAFGVYDRDIEKSGYPVQGADEWQVRMTNALKRAETYVWSYAEKYDWLNTGWPGVKVPDSILLATRDAIVAANS